MVEKTNIRIKDIADKAGVSTGTVDRVLHKRGKVSPVAKQKVLEAIEKLGYQPNLMARALGGNKKFSIGVLIPDPKLDVYWEMPKKGIEMAAKDYNTYGVTIEKFVYNQNNIDSFRQQAELIIAKDINGLIVAPLFYQPYLTLVAQCQEKNVPIVLFNSNVEVGAKLSYIGQDSYQSGRLAAHLMHKNLLNNSGKILILHLADDLETSTHLARKEEGFKDYFVENSIKQSIVTENVKSPISDILVYKLDALLEAYPDIKAFFVTTSKAHEVAAYLEGVDIQDKILVGFDLLPSNMDYLEKGVIDFIINQNAYNQGYKSVETFVNSLVLKKAVEKIVYLPLDIITKENAQYYLSES